MLQNAVHVCTSYTEYTAHAASELSQYRVQGVRSMKHLSASDLLGKHVHSTWYAGKGVHAPNIPMPLTFVSSAISVSSSIVAILASLSWPDWK